MPGKADAPLTLSQRHLAALEAWDAAHNATRQDAKNERLIEAELAAGEALYVIESEITNELMCSLRVAHKINRMALTQFLGEVLKSAVEDKLTPIRDDIRELAGAVVAMDRRPT